MAIGKEAAELWHCYADSQSSFCSCELTSRLAGCIPSSLALQEVTASYTENCQIRGRAHQVTISGLGPMVTFPWVLLWRARAAMQPAETMLCQKQIALHDATEDSLIFML